MQHRQRHSKRNPVPYIDRATKSIRSRSVWEKTNKFISTSYVFDFSLSTEHAWFGKRSFGYSEISHLLVDSYWFFCFIRFLVKHPARVISRNTRNSSRESINTPRLLQRARVVLERSLHFLSVILCSLQMRHRADDKLLLLLLLNVSRENFSFAY